MRWATANANVAFVKYWGKGPGAGNEAAAGSLSVTLDGLTTVAGVECLDGHGQDDLEGVPTPAVARISTFLDLARRELGVASALRVRIVSNFPVAAGLASSASTFAALAGATAAAAGAEVDAGALVPLARRGSGSACRSLFPGFVEWAAPEDGGDVLPVASAGHWPLEIVIAITRREPKHVGSRDGMLHTMATSPYYPAWLATNAADLETARRAILDRDLEALGRTAERSCFRMHAAALASDPPLLYWTASTLAVVHEVWRLRADGVPAWLTIDAGPQVKVFSEARWADEIETRLRAVDGVLDVLRSRPGDGLRILDAPPAWLDGVAGEARA